MELSRRSLVGAAVVGAALLFAAGVAAGATATPTTGSPGTGSGYAVFAMVRGLVGGLMAVFGVVSALGMVIGRAVTVARRAAGGTVTPRYGTRRYVRRLLGFATIALVGAGIAAGGTAYWAALVLAASAVVVAVAARRSADAWRSLAGDTLDVARAFFGRLWPGSRR